MEYLILLLLAWFLIATPKYGKAKKKASRKRQTKSNTSRNYSSGRNYSPRSPYLKPKKYTGRVYSYSPRPHEFLVYMVENKKLNSLKVGVGTYGRVHQLINSYKEPNYGSENIGWEILRLAKFSTSEIDYDSGKEKAYEAEKRAHFYWRYVLKEPRNLERDQMGYSVMEVFGETKFSETKGYTETVRLDKICEFSTWNYVINSPGFISEIPVNNARELRLIDTKASLTNIPEGYEEAKIKRIYSEERKSSGVRFDSDARFWEKVTKTETCWNWTGATSPTGYGIAHYENKNYPAHRLSWTLEIGSDPGLYFLDNKCENRKCVNPAHWDISLRRRSAPGEVRKSEYPCITEGCLNPAETMTKPGLCDSCKQKAKRARRKARKSEFRDKCRICGKNVELRGAPIERDLCQSCRK